ncbi:unnamed protein product [Trichobilharzia szidati]|nr:unnamed protein product [Trichobilharzia szidati]
MALAYTSICLLITAFFLCTCESANEERFYIQRRIMERKVKEYNDAMQINKKNISQYESDTKAQVKLVTNMIENKRRVKRFVKCQEMYTTEHSQLDAYNYLFAEIKKLKYLYITFAKDTDTIIYDAEHEIHKYSRVKRLIELISKKHAENASYLKNMILRSVFEGFLIGLQIVEKDNAHLPF